MRARFVMLLAALALSACAGQMPPNMIYDCQQPRLAALSKELGLSVCVQYDMIQTLKVMTPTVEAAARASVSHSNKVEVSADPNAISCREHDVAFRPPSLICARNSDWNQRWRRSFPEGPAETLYSGAMIPPHY